MVLVLRMEVVGVAAAVMAAVAVLAIVMLQDDSGACAGLTGGRTSDDGDGRFQRDAHRANAGSLSVVILLHLGSCGG